jgi:hypothetical protein
MAKQLATSTVATTPAAVVARATSLPRAMRPSRAPAPPVDIEDEEQEDAPPQLTKRTQKMLDAVRTPFRQHVTAFGTVHEKAAALAPEFIRTFYAWHKETHGTFIGFVRLLDPTVPANRDASPENDGYRGHKSYQAADYLRRLVTRRDRPEDEEDEGERPAPMQDALVRVLAAFISVIPGNQVDHLWTMLGTGLKWSERRVAKLRGALDAAEPLMGVSIERGHVLLAE